MEKRTKLIILIPYTKQTFQIKIDDGRPKLIVYQKINYSNLLRPVKWQSQTLMFLCLVVFNFLFFFHLIVSKTVS